jgi:hypothetical protein
MYSVARRDVEEAAEALDDDRFERPFPPIRAAA